MMIDSLGWTRDLDQRTCSLAQSPRLGLRRDQSDPGHAHHHDMRDPLSPPLPDPSRDLLCRASRRTRDAGSGCGSGPRCRRGSGWRCTGATMHTSKPTGDPHSPVVCSASGVSSCWASDSTIAPKVTRRSIEQFGKGTPDDFGREFFYDRLSLAGPVLDPGSRPRSCRHRRRPSCGWWRWRGFRLRRGG